MVRPACTGTQCGFSDISFPSEYLQLDHCSSRPGTAILAGPVSGDPVQVGVVPEALLGASAIQGIVENRQTWHSRWICIVSSTIAGHKV